MLDQQNWWESRTAWTSILTVLASIAALFNIVVTPADMETLIAICLAIGTVITGISTFIFRMKAKKTIK